MKFNIKNATSFVVAAGILGTTLIAPVAANADQNSRNQWGAIALGSAIVAGIGIADHNNTLATVGVLGAGYSAVRYDEDRGHDRDWNRDNCGNGYQGGYQGGYNNGGYDNRGGYNDQGYRGDRR